MGGGRSFSSGYSPGDRRGGGSCSRRWTPSHARPAGHGVAPGSAPGRGVRGHAPTCRGAHETLDTGFIQNQGCIDPHGLTGEQDARNGRSPQWTRGGTEPDKAAGAAGAPGRGGARVVMQQNRSRRPRRPSHGRQRRPFPSSAFAPRRRSPRCPGQFPKTLLGQREGPLRCAPCGRRAGARQGRRRADSCPALA